MKFQRLYQNVSLVFPVIKMFDRNIRIYNTALKNSTFDQTLTYDEQDKPTSDSVNEESNQRKETQAKYYMVQPTIFYKHEDKCR